MRVRGGLSCDCVQLTATLTVTVTAMPPPTVLTEFDREITTGAEGDWKSDDDPSAPLPVIHPSPWPGQSEFMSKLHGIERELTTLRCREDAFGFSHCVVCNLQFNTSDHWYSWTGGMAWNGSFLTHYVRKHNVKPSHQFYHWVMTFPMTIQAVAGRQQKRNAELEHQRRALVAAEEEGRRFMAMTPEEHRADYNRFRERWLKARYGDNWNRVDTHRPLNQPVEDALAGLILQTPPPSAPPQ